MHFNEGTKLLDKLVLVQYVNDLSLANCDKTVYVLDSMHIAKRGNSLHLHPNFSCAWEVKYLGFTLGKDDEC